MIQSAKHFYAQVCEYGTDVLSEFDVLCRFATKEDRDEFVADSDRVEAVTSAYARRRYDLRKFDRVEDVTFVHTDHFETVGIFPKEA